MRGPKNKKHARAYQGVGFKAYVDTDADILAWWNEMEAGKGSHILRSLIRSHIAASEASELAELKQEVRQLSERIDRLISHGVMISGNGSAPHEELDDAQAAKRRQQILGRKW